MSSSSADEVEEVEVDNEAYGLAPPRPWCLGPRIPAPDLRELKLMMYLSLQRQGLLPLLDLT